MVELHPHRRDTTPNNSFKLAGLRPADLLKHGVEFDNAALVLEDELASTMRDLYSEREERALRDPGTRPQWERLLDVVYTWRGERARLISAREATNKERRDYEKNP